MNLDQRLADAARHVAEQVDPPDVDLDAVRSRAHANRRRTVALAVAAAVAAVGLAAIPLLATGRATTAPQPAASPTSHIIRNLVDSDCAVDQCLKPNTYAIPLGQDGSQHRLRAKLTVQSDGWDARWDSHRISRANAEGAVVLTVYQPDAFAGPQPCGLHGATMAVARDATMDDVVRLLTALPQFAVLEGPRALPAFGHDTRYLKVRADRVTCPPGRGARYQLADIYWGDGHDSGGESAIEPGRPVLVEFWALELEGKPVLVEARHEGRPDTAMIDQLDQVRQSLTFGFRR